MMRNGRAGSSAAATTSSSSTSTVTPEEEPEEEHDLPGEQKSTGSPPTLPQRLPEQGPVPPGVADLNAMFQHDPRFSSAYATELYRCMPERELAKTASPSYLDGVQTCVKPKMRNVVVDWMVDYHTEENLRHTTLFTAVNYLDRALERRIIVHSRKPFEELQLLGMVCLRLACKFEETGINWCRHIEDWLPVLQCSRSKIYAWEFDVAQKLKWECAVCTSAHSITRFVQASNADILPSDTPTNGQDISTMDYRNRKGSHVPPATSVACSPGVPHD